MPSRVSIARRRSLRKKHAPLSTPMSSGLRPAYSRVISAPSSLIRVCSCSSERSTSRFGLLNSDAICAEDVAKLIVSSSGLNMIETVVWQRCCDSALWCDILLKLSVQVNLVQKFGLLYFRFFKRNLELCLELNSGFLIARYSWVYSPAARRSRSARRLRQLPPLLPPLRPLVQPKPRRPPSTEACRTMLRSTRCSKPTAQKCAPWINRSVN